VADRGGRRADGCGSTPHASLNDGVFTTALTLDERRKALDEGLDAKTSGLINHTTFAIEHFPGGWNSKTAFEPRPHPERSHDRQPCGLREQRGASTGCRADDRHGPSTKHARNVGGRPREPINGVLEHPRYRVVVLGRDDEQTVSRFDARFLTVDREAIAHQLPGIVHAEAELVELTWLPIEQAQQLDLPLITGYMLEELQERIDAGFGADLPVPFYATRGGEFTRELIE